MLKNKYILFWGQTILSLVPIFFMMSNSYNSNLLTNFLEFIMEIPVIWFLLSNLFIMFFTYKPSTEKCKRCFFDFSKRWLFSTLLCYGMYYICIHFFIIISYLL